MVKSGLKMPLSVTSDGVPGLIKAIEEIFSLSLWYISLGSQDAQLVHQIAAGIVAGYQARGCGDQRLTYI